MGGQNGGIIKVEPYWNVKFSQLLIDNIYQMIKVEPYWNKILL